MSKNNANNANNLEIISDNHKVIYNGSLILFRKNSIVQFKLYDITLELDFRNSDNGTKSSFKLNYEKSNDNFLSFICSGYNFELGSGITNPIPIITLDNEFIYFRFIAYNINRLPYLAYTFYRGK